MGLVDEFQKLHELCKVLNDIIKDVENNLSAGVKKLNDMMTKEFGSLQGKSRGLKKLIQRITDYLKSLFGDTPEKKGKKKTPPPSNTEGITPPQGRPADRPEDDTEGQPADKPEDDTEGQPADKPEDDTEGQHADKPDDNEDHDNPEDSDKTKAQSTNDEIVLDERLKQLLKFSVLGHSYPYGVKLNRYRDEDRRTVVGVDTKVTQINDKETAYTCFNPEKDD